MKTFIIQFKTNANEAWLNYTDDNGFSVEFVHISGATTVAKGLASSSETHPSESSL